MSEILVLCYHGVSERWPADVSVTPKAFRAQLEMVARAGYRGATLIDALTAPRWKRTVVVTFDDAFRSTLELARPILDDLKLPATVFVPTDYAGTEAVMGWSGYEEWVGGEHERDLVCATWDHLRDLQSGGWEIGSHTCSHPRLTQVDDAALERELVDSRRICERELDRPCVSFAYPYSDEDDRVAEATRRAGYGLAVTVPTAWQSPLPLRWPRVQIDHEDSLRRLRVRIARRKSREVDAGARLLLGVARRARSAVDGRLGA